MKKIIMMSMASVWVSMIFAQSDILDARTNFNVGDEVTVTGIVTNDGSLGAVRYIQDASAGVVIYPGSNWDGWPTPAIGDEVTVTGVLSEFNGLLEVGSSLSSVSINNSGNPLPMAQIITPNDMGEDLEAELVTIENCLFEIGSGCSNSGGALEIQGNSTYNFISNGQTGTIYIRSGNVLVGTFLPIGEITIHGVLSQFSFSGFDGYQILPRNIDDFEGTSSINLASSVTQSELSTSSFTVLWTTDVAGNSELAYGLTPDLGSVVVDATVTTDHSILLDGLIAGSIYWVQATTFSGIDQAVSPTRPFATKSNSSGAIRVYFNQPVDNSFATIENAVSIGADMNDTIAKYIMSAQHTIDFAVYNINNSVIVNAINEANANGVEIRYIAQGTNSNMGIGNFDAGIAVHYREDDAGSGMHNKFAIIDADYEDLSVVMTGSTNYTTGNLVNDFNNLIIFMDQSMARGYRLEFEEMWGGSGPSPDPVNSKFGAEKTINTPTKYLVGDVPVEVYFSPTDHTTSAIECALLETQTDCNFALLTMTRDELAAAIISVDNIFVQTKGIIEQVSSQGSEYQTLLDGGIDVVSHEGVPGQLHHKYCTIDHSNPDSDPTLITGSHNWSSSAENINDENTVIVHDERIANLYYQEFMATYNSVVGIDELPVIQTIAYPNPTDMYLNVVVRNGAGNYRYSLVDISGKLIQEGNLRSGSINILDLRSSPHGSYVLSIPALGFGKTFVKR